jgi:formiminotetrahydrofolate cyclodeaminase
LSRSPSRDVPEIRGLTLINFISGLGSGAPTPGAGAACAVTLALSAACAAKAFAISARHSKESALDEAAARARAIASMALEGAQRDAADFRAWLKTHDQRAGAALQADATALFALAGELRTLIADWRPRTIAALTSDLDAADKLLRASIDIERRNLADL